MKKEIFKTKGKKDLFLNDDPAGFSLASAIRIYMQGFLEGNT